MILLNFLNDMLFC